MFKITDFVEFDSSNRAVCPNCALEGKAKKRNLSLIPDSDGAYKCHRGCSPETIRAALGQEKPRQVPTAIAQQPQKTSTSVAPHRIAEDHRQLMDNSTQAMEWLNQRGISREIAAHYKLGIARSKVGNRHLPGISIPLPNHSATAYWRKKRVAPWLPAAELPDEYQAWSQYAIPQQTFLTHNPPEAKTTYLCEGEWDAIRLGWELRGQSEIAIAAFTCGCSASPSVEELDRLPGEVVIFYDIDEPGRKGAEKLAGRLGKRAKVATVPAPDDCPEGWDISDALDYCPLSDIHAAAAAAIRWRRPEKVSDLRQRIVTNDELMARAPDYIEWLVPDLFTPNELFILGMPPRGGKSLFCMTLAKAIATGGKFLDRPVTQGSVLYINLEDGEAKIKTRQTAQVWSKGLPVYWLDKFKLNELNDLAEAIEHIEDLRLIIIDTFSRVRSDGSKETGAEMGQVLEPLQELAKDKNICILITHHLSKGTLEEGQNPFDLLRGSGSIRATCRGAMVIIPGESCYRLLSENGHSDNLDLRVRIYPETLEWQLLGNWQPKIDGDMKAQILDHLNLVGQATVTQVAESLNFKASSVSTTLYRLHADDMVAKTGGSGRAPAVYSRSPNLSQQGVLLLGHQDADGVRSVALSQQVEGYKSFSDQSDHLAESDQNRMITSPENDHFPAVIDILLGQSYRPCSEGAVVSQQAPPLLGQVGTTEKKQLAHTKPGDRVYYIGSDTAALRTDGTKQLAHIKPGDQVYYVGSNSADFRICGERQLTVKAVSDGIAVLTYPKWLVTQSIAASDLEIAE